MKVMRKNLHDSKKEEITDELHLAGLGHEIIRYVKPRIHTHRRCSLEFNDVIIN